MIKILISLFAISLFANVAFSQVCTTNNFFEAEGWDTHTGQDFAAVSNNVLAYYELNKKDFVDDITESYYSEALDALVDFQSYDDLRTPDREMFGDIVVLKKQETGELLEVRWYADQTKHIIYNHALQECAQDLIPDADNTLF